MKIHAAITGDGGARYPVCGIAKARRMTRDWTAVTCGHCLSYRPHEHGGPVPRARPAPDAREVADRAQAERDLQTQIIELAKLTGWLQYHTYDSRRSEPGFPDLVLVKPPRIIFAELKSEDGDVTPDQETWLSALGTVATGVRQFTTWTAIVVVVWRPSDWPEIEQLLTRDA